MIALSGVEALPHPAEPAAAALRAMLPENLRDLDPWRTADPVRDRVLRRAAAMGSPSPDNPQRAPVWENYVVAQCAQAALGL
ncbi:hypothetical protein, partial [Streptococcus pyogenes]|uniref:hypothetical protein n=1 Tax=Streptococcus pyogenes TaxID=1314 RepID=UPI003DA18BD8